MEKSKRIGFALIALAAAFLAIGISTNKSFFVAAAFLAVGIAFVVQSRKCSIVMLTF